MKLIAWLATASRAAVAQFASWLGLFGFGPRPYRVQVVEDLPERLKPRVLYVVGEGSVQMHATMACPRGRCRDAVNMNLLPDDHPVWTLSIGSDELPSLRPSVWRKTSCGCHFWLRDGNLHWC
jgi:hypothetical protein